MIPYGKALFFQYYPLMALFPLDMKKKERYFVYKGNVPWVFKPNKVFIYWPWANKGAKEVSGSRLLSLNLTRSEVICLVYE